MRSKGKAGRKAKGRPREQEEVAPRRSEDRSGKGKGKKARREESRKNSSKGKSDYQLLAEAIIGQTPIPNQRPEKFGRPIEAAFWALDKEDRIRIRKKYKTYERWERRKKDRKLAKGFGAFLRIDSSGKRIAKESRTKESPTIARDQFVALLKPFVVVSDDPEHKTVIADAGSVVQRCDQGALYRERVSPVTHRSDELLVRFGKPDKPTLGWLPVQAKDSKATKAVKKGPTFLVATKREEDASAWDLFRLKIGRARAKDPGEWIVPWLVRSGAKYPTELRALVRLFGGKPIKNEGFDARCAKALTLILSTEISMATAKAVKKSAKKGAKKAAEVETKKSKKTKVSKKTAAKSGKKSSDDNITKEHDGHVIRRLVKENPRRAGSNKAKIWAKLKKGMSVGEFVEKGGTRGAVRHYIRSGWAKLLKPKADTEE